MAVGADQRQQENALNIVALAVARRAIKADFANGCDIAHLRQQKVKLASTLVRNLWMKSRGDKYIRCAREHTRSRNKGCGRR